MKKNSLWRKILPPLLSVMLAAGSVPWTVPAGAEEVTGDSDEAAMIAAAQAAAEEAARQEEESRAAQAAAEEAARVAAELERAQAEAEAAAAAAAVPETSAASAGGEQAAPSYSTTDHSGQHLPSSEDSSGYYPAETTVDFGGETIREQSIKPGSEDDPVLEELIFDEDLLDASMDLAEAQEFEERLLALPKTGDWAEDLSAAALSQVGYEESMADFVMLESGRVGGYTFYGAERDVPYDPWCGAFVSCCLNRIDADDQVLGYTLPYTEWIPYLKQKDLYKPAGSGETPKKGDLIFISLSAEAALEAGKETVSFDSQGVADSLLGSSPNRAGVVTDIKDGKLIVVEGDVHDAVAVCEYAPDDPCIAGFVSMKQAAEQGGSGHLDDLVESDEDLFHDDTQDDIPSGEEQGQNAIQGRTLADNVNVRIKPGTDSDAAVIAVIEAAGTQLPVYGSVQSGDQIWYQVSVNGLDGFIRGDLLETEMPEVVEQLTEAQTETMTEAQTESHTEIETEKQTEILTEPEMESVTEAETESETEALTEPEMESITEPQTEAVTEEMTEDISETVTESATEELTEKIIETVTEEITEVVTESITEELSETPASEFSAQPEEIEGVLVQVVPEDPEKIPAGSAMKVEVIRDESITASAESRLEEEDQENVAVRSAVGLKLVFTDADGREFVPETKLYVKIRKPEENELDEEVTQDK